MNDLFRELKTSSLFQIPFFACLGSLMFALAAWLLRHLCLSPWFYGSLCLALALASWAAIHPLDYFLRKGRKLDLTVSAKMAFGTAISVTFISVTLFLKLLNSYSSECRRTDKSQPILPILSKQQQAILKTPPVQDLTTTEILQWRQWHATLWNTMFLDRPIVLPIGTKAKYSFKVSRDLQISDVDVLSDTQILRDIVFARIQELNGTDVLKMPKGSTREFVIHNEEITVCSPESDRCGLPSEGYKDDEEIKISR
jgi:hypothetical protein